MINERWDLEDLPYETNDAAGGWYLHFDPTGENDDAVLYMSRAHVSPERARLIATAPELLDVCKEIRMLLLLRAFRDFVHEPWAARLLAAIETAEGTIV